MTQQPDPQSPKLPDAPQSWIELVKAIGIVVAALGGIVSTIMGFMHKQAQQETQQTVQVAAEKADTAAVKADKAAAVGERNEKLNTAAVETLVRQTDDPQAKAVVAEVKAEAATQPGK